VVFGVDSALDGVALDLDVFLFVGYFFTCGDLDGHFDDVDACDGFGDGVFDLDSGVDFEHVEVLFFVHEEFDGGGAGVVCGFDEFGGCLADFFDFFAFNAWGGCFFDDFLVSALHGAVAFVEVDGVAVFVADGLDFYMAGVFEEFFDEDAAVSECGECFLLCFGDICSEGCFVSADAHASASASCGCFDDDGVADFCGDFDGFVEFFDFAFGAWEDGYFGGSCVMFCLDFIAEFSHGFWGGADEFYFTFSADFGEVCSF